MEPFRKWFILVGITDKYRIELDRFIEEGGEVVNHHVRETTAL